MLLYFRRYSAKTFIYHLFIRVKQVHTIKQLNKIIHEYTHTVFINTK